MEEETYPGRMRPQRRVREAEKIVLPPGNFEALAEHLLEPLIYIVIADFRVEEEILAILIAELKS